MKKNHRKMEKVGNRKKQDIREVGNRKKQEVRKSRKSEKVGNEEKVGNWKKQEIKIKSRMLEKIGKKGYKKINGFTNI